MIHYYYQIPSKIEEINAVIENLEQKWREHEIDEKTIFSLHLCLEELATNAVLHGNRSNPELKVDINCYLYDKAVEISVHDQGAGFNPQAVANPTLDNNVGKTRGRGLYIVKNFMDSVEFKDNASTVLIRKILCSSASTICEDNQKLYWQWEKGKAVSVLRLIGSLNIDTAAYFQRETEKLPQEFKLIIDCSSLNYIDSTGLSCLIDLRQKMEQAKGLLRLAALQEKVKAVFETTRLNTIFEIYCDVNLARQGL